MPALTAKLISLRKPTQESIHSDCTSSSGAGSTSAAATSSATSNQLFAIAAAAASSSHSGGGTNNRSPSSPSAGTSSSDPSNAATSSSSSSAASSSNALSSTSATPHGSSTLSEVARQYEESRAQKRKYEEVETFTGEEHETNVMDVNCKLFAFVASNWEERGPGNLRVNDNKNRQKSSRVVFRTSGNLRVLLNTIIWPGMVVERPSQKSLRFSAIDADGQIRIFLVMVSVCAHIPQSE